MFIPIAVLLIVLLDLSQKFVMQEYGIKKEKDRRKLEGKWNFVFLAIFIFVPIACIYWFHINVLISLMILFFFFESVHLIKNLRQHQGEKLYLLNLIRMVYCLLVALDTVLFLNI